MKISIIGGSGFIGTNLISILSKDVTYQLINIDKAHSSPNANITQIADIRNKEQLAEKLQPADWCVLLAAEHRDDVTPSSLYYDVNVRGTGNVLDVMEERGTNKIIFTSSVAIYGLNKPNPDEDYPPAPFNDYGKSKWQAEEALRKWYFSDPDNRTLIILRPTVVFGPGNRGNVYNLLKQIISGRFLMIGDGRNRKSMAYVENITGFLKYCIDTDMSGYQVFNYVDKPDLNMNEFVNVTERSLGKKLSAVRIPYFIGYFGGVIFDILARITGKKFSISSIRVRKFCATTQYKSKFVTQCKYRAHYSLKQGLVKTIDSILREE
ncbi:NAD-dependent epimerase/dehydratase family protein [Compostibacter hankyongensis]|uniref:N-acetyl-alpha-D-glucosaminyl-diphospho-ditrans, octacis-undecaprenol 4-epimerase n=1 Tax=Compostibacter hankyongensis TaxID=1007089 RepID=A0ABP8FUZ8_9BACT